MRANQIALSLVLPSVRAGLLLVLGVLAAPPVAAATYYVDGNCPTSGSGLSLACGPSGPKRLLDEGIALMSAPGDVVRVRGVHSPHDGEATAFDGRYFADWVRFNAKHGSASAPLTIQPHGYSGPGTGEKVFIDGTRAPTSGWTRCSDCTTGVCAGVPAAACSQTWYATDSSNANLVIGAQKDDGSPTYRVTAPADLTNAHPEYNPKRCSTTRYLACQYGDDCPTGETCSALSPEIDSYSPQNGGPILVRWGTTLPAKPYVHYNNNGMGFYVSNSSFITIKGFVVRCHKRAGFTVAETFGPATDVVIQDNQVLYSDGARYEGSDYGVVVYHSQNVSILDNMIGYTVSEGIHSQAVSSGPTKLIIRGNWVHNQGDPGIFGVASHGTPSGMILGGNGNTSNADYGASILENNLIERQKSPPSGGSIGRGVILENSSSNWTIRNNVFRSPNAECLKLDGTSTTVSGNQIYNNLFLKCGANPGPSGGGGPGIYVFSETGKAANNNKIYHNTFAGGANGAIVAECRGTCTGNEIRNNVMYDTIAGRQVNWPPTGVFQNNLVHAPGTGTLVTFSGTSFNCSALVPTADVDRDGVAGDQVRCVNPLFVSAAGNDFHLTTGSVAVDAATTNGVPAGRTASIMNTLSARHGLPSYADNSPKSGTNWDLGATETLVGGAPSASMTLSDPSPTAAGSVTVTLSTTASVVVLPGPLTFTASDGSTRLVTLSGAIPGTQFAGVLVVGPGIPDGPGTFTLPPGNLVDSDGNSGNVISSGGQTVIDQTPPAPPTNVRTGT